MQTSLTNGQAKIHAIKFVKSKNVIIAIDITRILQFLFDYLKSLKAT